MVKSDWLNVMWLETLAMSHHGFVVEWKPLHGPECVCCARDITEHDKRLTSHLEWLECDNVHYGPKLRENGIEWFLQFCMRVWWMGKRERGEGKERGKGERERGEGRGEREEEEKMSRYGYNLHLPSSLLALLNLADVWKRWFQHDRDF